MIISLLGHEDYNNTKKNYLFAIIIHKNSIF